MRIKGSPQTLATTWRQYKRYFLPFALARRFGLARGAHGEIIAYMPANKKIRICGFFYWRSGRDSNPRSRLRDYSISSRARYDLFDTAPNQQPLLYHIFLRIARGKSEIFIVFSSHLWYNALCCGLNSQNSPKKFLQMPYFRRFLVKNILDKFSFSLYNIVVCKTMDWRDFKRRSA